ncbi:MAG TPA: hypothetical protein VGH47_05250, partial [Xanthobacteraceae bacterium]
LAATFLLRDNCRNQSVELLIIKMLDRIRQVSGRSEECVAGSGKFKDALAEGAEGSRADAGENRSGADDRLRTVPMRRSCCYLHCAATESSDGVCSKSNEIIE